MSDILPVTLSDTAIFDERGYSFNRLLGEGSYAKVWLVTYRITTDSENRVCSLACKIVDSKKAPRDFINKFLPREMDILTKINHPHLIHLHSIYQRKTKFFIFMRYAERGDLLDHILAHGEVKESQARLWTRQLSLGLQYLHHLDIVHRDIKCENVLITGNNNVKLADFGFSRFMVDSTGKKYLSSTYCGSLAYAAPELLKGKPYDPKRSDVWSLGIVTYVMLNQCMPFNDADMKKLYELQMNARWSFRSRIARSITDDVKTLVQRMLEPVTADRITIEDVVTSSWFSNDDRLKEMSQREREALDTGMMNKSGMLPKSQKLTIPSWKKRNKKDEQLVCVTSLRFERSSNQFQFETPQVARNPVENTVRAPHIRDAPVSSRIVTNIAPASQSSRDGNVASKDAIKIKSITKADHESRKGKEGVIQKPKEDDRRKRPEEMIKPPGVSPSGAIVRPRMSKDRFTSVDELPRSGSKAGPVTESFVLVRPNEPSQVSGFIKAGKAETLATLGEGATQAPTDVPEIEERTSEVSDENIIA